MRGLSIKFKTDKTDIELSESHDFELVIQNMLVNLGQASGSSSMFPTKGTTMLKDSLEGGVIDDASANRIGGNAAVDTIFFLREYEIPGQESLKELAVLPEVYENGVLRFQVNLKSTLDRSMGLVLDI